DLKPANIIIGPDDQATIVDFGVALLDTAPSLTTTGLIVGTPLYMSPEQIRGQDVDGRSDQYSLAVILYEMLTGQFPYEAISVPAIYHHQLLGQPIPITERDPRLPAAIEAALNRAMAKEPGQRFASVADLNRALRRRAPRKSSPRPEGHYLHPEPRWQQAFAGEITAVYPGPSHLFVVTVGGQLAALAADSGEILWQVEVDGRITHLVHQQDIVVAVTAVGSLVAWRVGDGRPLWQRPLNQPPLALHVPNPRQLLIVFPNGELVYLNLADGEEIKRLTLSITQSATIPAPFSGEQLLLSTGKTITSYTPLKDEN
ncbi:MAG: PQQ-binding-like beta-propeller repeat protein, partial [Anaerolineae bacterium]|nr:PQQ-binding-like beta-propeller repeat protein [Anaerolineae bacterium]